MGESGKIQWNVFVKKFVSWYQFYLARVGKKWTPKHIISYLLYIYISCFQRIFLYVSFILAPNFYMNTIDPSSMRHHCHCCFLIKQLGVRWSRAQVFTLIAFTCVIFISYAQEFGVQNYADIFIPWMCICMKKEIFFFFFFPVMSLYC